MKKKQNATKWSTHETFVFYELRRSEIREIIEKHRHDTDAFMLACTDIRRLVNDLLNRFRGCVGAGSDLDAICHCAIVDYIHVEEIVDRVMYHADTLPDD